MPDIVIDNGCYLCSAGVSGEPTLYIGNNKWRHVSCDPIKYGLMITEDRELANVLWAELFECADVIHMNRLKLLGILSTYNNQRLYRIKGFSTWPDFCKYLGMKKSWSYELLKIANNPYLLECVRANPKLIEERPKHLTIIADVATGDNVEELVSKAERMTVSDLKNDIMPHSDGGEFVTKSFKFRRADLASLEDAINIVKRETGESNYGTCIVHLAESYLEEQLAT